MENTKKTMKCPKCDTNIGFASKSSTYVRFKGKETKIGFGRFSKKYQSVDVCCNNPECDFKESVWMKVDIKLKSGSKLKKIRTKNKKKLQSWKKRYENDN